MTQAEIKTILNAHKEWLYGQGGSHANLCGANLCGANLCDANLRDANLRGANLRDANLCDANLCGANLCGANLCDANLRDANLRGANLRDANLCDANLRDANLRGANLCGANLCGANLRGANLCGANLENIRANEKTSFFWLTCPETGEFTAYKKCRDGAIVTLLITEDAKRSSATTRKCRASKAIVVSIEKSGIPINEAVSQHDSKFVYRVGETVEVQNFDEDRWNECSHGIHFFITRREAELY